MRKGMEIVERVNNRTKGGNKKKMKKAISMGIIGILVSAMLLASMASPALANESSAYTPRAFVYGDANEDRTVDMRDVTYIKLVIFKKKPERKLADANYDGKISMLDVGQAKLIVLGKEKELTLLDMDDRTVTIPQPLERVLGIGWGFIENTMFVLGVEDRIIGSGGAIRSTRQTTTAFLIPAIKDLPDVGNLRGINYETVATTNPDLVIVRKSVYSAMNSNEAIEMIEKLDIPVIALVDPNHFHTSDISTIYQEIEILGEIFDKEEPAQQLINDLDTRISFIIERTSDIKEEDKPRVLFCGLGSSRTRDKGGILIVWAKECASTFADLINIKSAYEGTGRAILSDEQVLALNPDVIILETSPGGYKISNLYEEEYYKNIQEVKAIKEKRVYSIGGLTGAGAIQLELPLMLMIEAKGTYPEKFSDITVSEWAEEYYKEIYHISGDEAKELKPIQGLDWLDEYDF
jgi:iron complex transport system substrate-binding protein